MTDRRERERSAGWAGRASFAVLVLAASLTVNACAGSEASPIVTETGSTTPAATVPAPATAEAAIALPDAPHSGDRPVADGCPAGGEMLDWDDDGWGDCVQTAPPPTVGPTP